MAERIIIIAGERINLTTITRDDLPLMTRWYADLEINAYLGRPGSFMTENHQEWFDRQAKDQSMRNFGIMVKESGALIGGVSLVHLNHLHRTAELAICIGERDAWSKGYGTEAVLSLIHI